jgi:hypothetical protein
MQPLAPAAVAAIPSTTPRPMNVNMSLTSLKKLTVEQRKVFLKIIHGSRRPMPYPEFLTLEVLRPGLASGNLAALLTDPEEKAIQSDLFRTDYAFGQLQALLRSGNYKIDLPEHAAMLVIAWLLEQGRDLDAAKLLATLAPWINEVKFVPTIMRHSPSNYAALTVPQTAAIGNVALARERLTSAEYRGVAMVNFYEEFNRVNVALMHLQAQAVFHLIDTLGAGDLPRQGVPVRNAIPKSCALPLQTSIDDGSPRARAIAETIRDMTLLLRNSNVSVRHSRGGSATRVLLRALRKVAAQSRGVVVPPAATRYSDGLVKHVQQIMASILTRRGSGAACNAYVVHMTNVERSMASDQRHITSRVIAERLSSLDGSATISVAVLNAALSPITKSDAARHLMTANGMKDPSDGAADVSFFHHRSHATTQPLAALRVPLTLGILPRIKRSHRKAVAVALDASFADLLLHRSIASAEEAGIVLHTLVARHRGITGFSDLRLSRLYCDLAVAFSRRRSLLLLSNCSTHQHQVRIHELPWATPLLEGMMDRDEQRDRDFARTFLKVYWQRFPVTLMPNKVVSALRELLGAPSAGSKRSRVDENENEDNNASLAARLSPLPPLLEELAADIFGRTFSSKFVKVARTAAPLLKDTTYSRYYMLEGSLLDQIERKEVTLMDAAVLLRHRYYIHQAPSGVFLFISGRGMLIEAAQILTTHNLIMSHFLFDDNRRDDGSCMTLSMEGIVEQAWRSLIKLNSTPPPQFGGACPTHARQVSHAFRQFLFFLSRLATAAVQRDFLDVHVAQLRAKYCVMPSLSRSPPTSTHAELVEEFCGKIEVVRRAVMGEPVDPREIALGWRHLC